MFGCNNEALWSSPLEKLDLFLKTLFFDLILNLKGKIIQTTVYSKLTGTHL